MRIRTNGLCRFVLLPLTCLQSVVCIRKFVSLPPFSSKSDVQAVAPYKNMLRLRDVVGYSGRQNNVLFIPGNSAREEKRKHVVFFPGDVQNYRDNMASHFSNHKWVEWCYEITATLLASKFPQAWIWLVEPTKMHDGIFSCYDNFLTANLLGAPENFDNHDAMLHLQALLRSAINVVNNHADGNTEKQVCVIEEESCKESESSVSVLVKQDISVDLPVVLIGFSKGCVVLNQFLHDLQLADGNAELQKFVHQISAWYWVDGGHSKERDTWITSEDVLSELAKLKTKLRVLVTPYQIRDKNRPYIGEEERMFVDTLRRLGADVAETVYFSEEERSLASHFKVLENLEDV